MNIEENLKKLKKEYREIEPSERFLSEGFSELGQYLDLKPSASSWQKHFFRGVVFAGLVLFLLTGSLAGVVRASWDSLPGDLLYPVKRATENVVSGFGGDGQEKVERRANEVIEVVKKDKNREAVDEAVREYQKAVLEEQKRVERHEERKVEFKENLSDQEERFRNLEDDDLVKEAIRVLEQAREEVKGEKTESEDNSGRNGGDSRGSGEDSNQGKD